MDDDAVAALGLRFTDAAKTLLAVDWRDGHVSVFPLAYLRGWCPCALCQGHGLSRRWVAPPPGAGLVRLQQVGAYAISLAWSDGHETGIYSWEFLREACPCGGCAGPFADTPAEVLALLPAAGGSP